MSTLVPPTALKDPTAVTVNFGFSSLKFSCRITEFAAAARTNNRVAMQLRGKWRRKLTWHLLPRRSHVVNSLTDSRFPLDRPQLCTFSSAVVNMNLRHINLGHRLKKRVLKLLDNVPAQSDSSEDSWLSSGSGNLPSAG